MIYIAPCIMLLMQAASIARYWVFWAPNGTRLSARCHFTGPKKLSISRFQPCPTCPSNGCCPHQKHYARGRMNHWCIGGFMYKIPPWRSLLCITAYLRVHTYTRMLARDRLRRWRAHEGGFRAHTVGVGVQVVPRRLFFAAQQRIAITWSLNYYKKMQRFTTRKNQEEHGPDVK